MNIIMSGPIKPLTEVERAFASAKLDRIRSGEDDAVETYGGITLVEAAGVLGVSVWMAHQYYRIKGWREVRSCKASKKAPRLVSLEDVLDTARKLKQEVM